MFSKRTQWDLTKNKLTLLLEKKRAAGDKIIDLTVSNPTQCQIQYPEKEILAAFQKSSNLLYEPHPKGLLSARNAIKDYYQEKGVSINPEQLFLTASTSEGYSFLFRLLANAGDSMLIPRPSYPLFQMLAEINDVELQPYNLIYNDGWETDFESIERTISHRTKGIILVNPNNPTGSFIKKKEYQRLIHICREHHLVIISDEVFSDYAFDHASSSGRDVTCYVSTMIKEGDIEDGILSFTLNGISKMLGLPQMKLGWIYVNGEEKMVKEAVSRMEIIADAYLSVGTPVQQALPELLKLRKGIQKEILQRVLSNWDYLKKEVSQKGLFQCLHVEGGWYGVVRIPEDMDEEKFILKLLDKQNILIHPGYFFDFQENGYLVLSLLPPETIFQQAVQEIK